MIRLFLAIDFPPSLKKQLADLVEQLVAEDYPLVAFEKEENFHLTLKFLGWVDYKLKVKSENLKIKEIETAIEKATRGVKPFLFQPTEIGYFLRESLILWLGVDVEEGLRKLIKQLENELAKVGFKKEKRPFAAHITLARKRKATPARKWRRLAEEIKEKYRQSASRRIPRFQVKEITLMQSTLTARGSIYQPLASFSLKS